MLDAVTDLLLGGRCVGCARPGRPLCPACASTLPDTAFPAWPTPTPAGLVTPWTCSEYDGLVRAMVLAHKERAVFALRDPLARLLAVAVAGALAAGARGPVLLVPVASRPGTVRSRGHDPTYTLTRRAAELLRKEARPVTHQRMLVSRRGVVDQAGLDAEARAANLERSMFCPSAALRRLAGRRVRLIVCDDVLTTGATAREAQRALEATGLEVLAIATVAATRRRLPVVRHGES